jgi:multicomponent Na+:H+ antiporter subunit E
VVNTVSGKLPATFLCVWGMWIVLTASFDLQELAVGAVVSLLVAAISCNILFRGKIGKALNPKRWAYAIAYIPAYIWAEIKAHADVIYRILHPKMPIKPGIVKVPTKLRTDFGITGLANAITMTPGTLSVEVDEKKPSLYVHWIDVKAVEPDKTRTMIARPFERFLKGVFG